MYKCKVCGKEFVLKAESKYIVKENKSDFVLTFSTNEFYECFDCPACGCQNRVNERFGEAFYESKYEFKTPEPEFDKIQECSGDIAAHVKGKIEEEKNVPECFGTYEKNALACGECEFMVECNSKDCENEKEKSEECFEAIKNKVIKAIMDNESL